MIAGGWNHTFGPFEGMVYTAMQEAATRTFYLCELGRVAKSLRR
jgi:hypothetical protein